MRILKIVALACLAPFFLFLTFGLFVDLSGISPSKAPLTVGGYSTLIAMDALAAFLLYRLVKSFKGNKPTSVTNTPTNSGFTSLTEKKNAFMSRWREYDNRTQTREDGTRYNPETGEVLNDGRAAYFGAWEDTLTPLWKGQFEATFSYVSNKHERTRRTVKVMSIEKDYKDSLYFRGFCQLRNELRTFALDRIKTKLTIDGKKYDLWVYVNEKIGA